MEFFFSGVEFFCSSVEFFCSGVEFFCSGVEFAVANLTVVRLLSFDFGFLLEVSMSHKRL